MVSETTETAEETEENRTEKLLNNILKQWYLFFWTYFAQTADQILDIFSFDEIDWVAKQYLKKVFKFLNCIFYRFYKFLFSVFKKRGYSNHFWEDVSVQFSKNTIEPSFISSQILNNLISIIHEWWWLLNQLNHFISNTDGRLNCQLKPELPLQTLNCHFKPIQTFSDPWYHSMIVFYDPKKSSDHQMINKDLTSASI